MSSKCEAEKQQKSKPIEVCRANRAATQHTHHTQQLQFVLILLVYYYQQRHSLLIGAHDWCHQTVFIRSSIESELISFTDLWALLWGKVSGFGFAFGLFFLFTYSDDDCDSDTD